MLKKNDIDILPNLMLNSYIGDTKQLIADADIIKGFPFIKLAELVKFKRELGRDKDFEDIKLIENFLNK